MERFFAVAPLLLLVTATPSTIKEDAVSLLQATAQGAGTLQTVGSSKVLSFLSQRAGTQPENKSPSYNYKIGEMAEVKSQRFAELGGWVICFITGPGMEPSSYDIVIPGSAIMKSVPSIMLRKKWKVTTTPVPKEILPDLGQEEDVAGVDGRIDGEPGENVEILVRRGPRAGTWVAGWITQSGRLPDTYDVRVPTQDGNFTVMPGVPGNSMRKVDNDDGLGEAEEIDYKVGDRVEVKAIKGSGLSKRTLWVPGVITAEGQSSGLFSVYVRDQGYLFDLPRRVLRPKPITEMETQLAHKKEPILTDSVFQVGEDVEAKVLEGDVAGLWLKARIAGPGPVPWTYYINMTQWKIEELTMVMTYHELLRRPGQSLSRAAITSYEPGEWIEFKSLVDNETANGTWWWKGIIVKKGKAADSYDVAQYNGNRVPSLPVELMRKAYFDESRLPIVASREYTVGDVVEYKNILTGIWVNASVTAEGTLKGTYELQDNYGSLLHWMPPELLRRPATAFRVGDAVEVEGKKNMYNETVWTRATIQELGAAADTYDLLIEDVGVIKSVHFRKLRQAEPVSQKLLLNAYQVGEKVEMMTLYGADAGKWLSGTIASRGVLHATYNISVPGLGIAPNVPIETLKKVPSSRFKVGEFVRVRIQNGPGKGTCATGLVAGLGSIPDTFNISWWRSPIGTDIPIELLQKENQPWRMEDMPYYEVGANVKVRATLGPERGLWIPGTIVGQDMIQNTTRGPRPVLYTLTLPSYPEMGDVTDVPVELLMRDEFSLRPVTYLENIKANDTVQLKGLVGAGGAPWVKVYIVRNATKREAYDVHLPGVGIYPDIAIELIRRPGVQQQFVQYKVGERVEMKDIFDLGEDDKIWIPGRIKGPGKRPGTYDMRFDQNPDVVMPCIPVEILRRANGQEFRPYERIYYEGEIVEVKDMLGVIDPNAKTKAVFRVLGEGNISHTYDLEGIHIGVVKNIPSVLLVKVRVEDIEAMDQSITPGDFVECIEVDRPGNKAMCMVDSPGQKPGTFNVRINGYDGLFPNIPLARLYKAPTPLLPELEQAINVTAIRASSARSANELQVGDKVQMWDEQTGDGEWLEGTITGKGSRKNTFVVEAGQYGRFVDVSRDDIKSYKDEEEQQQEEQAVASTTTSPVAGEESGPLQPGDWVRYFGPGANTSNISTMWLARVIGAGQVPLTYNLGLDSGFVLRDIPFFYLVKDPSFTTTSTHSPEIMNTFASFSLVYPTVRLFQAMLIKQDEEWVKANEGDLKAQMASDFRGKRLGDGSVLYDIGERAEVQIVRGELKGQWAPCVITGMGRWANSYNIHLADAPEGLKDIPNVGSKVLRKLAVADDPEALRLRAASPCTDDERTLIQHSIENDGLYNNNPEECTKVAGMLGVNQDMAGKCVQKKIHVSESCSRCAVDFAKEFGSGDLFKKNCVLKCIPMIEACKNSLTNGPGCISKMGECMTCMKSPLVNLLKCVGAADSTTASKIEQLADAATSGALLAPGGLDNIFGVHWVVMHRALLQPLFGPAMGNSGNEAQVDMNSQLTAVATFEVGDKAEIRIQKGPYAGNWVECDITGKGQIADTYNIHIASAPEGKQDFPDVSALILRPSEANPDKPQGGGSAGPSDEDPL